MYSYNFKKIILSSVAFILLTLSLSISFSIKSNAMKVTHYSYDDIKSVLPEKYLSEDYFYKENNIPYIAFATYNNNNFRTTIKKKTNANKLLYCVNYNNSIIFDKTYQRKDNLYNNKLRVRLSIAFYYAPAKWNQKANKQFTTGNFVLDYYMTQIVVHSLIYKYGGEKSSNGIDFSKIKFKNDTGNLAKKTKAFYEYCCNAEVKYTDGYFQSVDFSFSKPEEQYMYLQKDFFVSPTINCIIATDNAEVSKYERIIESNISPDSEDVILEEDAQAYNSSFRVKTAQSVIDKLHPDVYKVNISEYVDFARKVAGFWKCTESGYEDTNQEVGELITENTEVSDQITFNLIIGELILYKSDSVTGEPISDANFEVLQYNSETLEYEPYKKLIYNSSLKRYESGNLYLSENNKEGKFKVVETLPGMNYILDWQGQFFEITPDVFIHEIHVENQPVLGKLKIKKNGEQWGINNNIINKNQTIALSNIKFALYAKENIYVKGKILYEKNKKIVDLITNKSGEVVVNDLPMGDYYIYETKTLDDYILDSAIHYFSITRDATRKYNEVNYTFNNKLKTAQIELFKYYFEKDDKEQNKKIPLEGAKFGLYLKNDICDINGKIVVKKDTCIKEMYSDKNGKIIFSDLPYAEYYIKELEAPEDFVINDGIITIKLEDFLYNDTLQQYNCKKEIVNLKQTYNIGVYKTGESFIGYKEEKSQYGNYFSYEIGPKELEKVTFSLYNTENELIDVQTTNQQGKAEFTNLDPGKYYLVESSAPAEYTIIETGKNITCNMNNKEYNIFSPPIIEEKFHNELCESLIVLSKYGEDAIVQDGTIAYEQIPLSNVLFGIFQNFDYSFANNTCLSKGSCVGYIVTDKDGKGVYTGKLPCGEYYLKEITTNPGYDLDPTEYPFSIKPNGNNAISISFQDENAFYNQLSKASVKIIKTDVNSGKKLKNVEFTLYNEMSEKIGVYKTDKKGEILVDNLPYGKYYFIETKTKKGYYSSNNKYYFTLDTDELITLNITNSPIVKLGFEENYKIWLLGIGIVLILFLLVTTFDIKLLKGDRKK